MVPMSSQLYPQDTNSLGLYTDKIRNLPEEKFGLLLLNLYYIILIPSSH